MTRIVATTMCVALLFAGAAFGDEEKLISFELKDTDGKMHKSSDLKDKYVVLEWTETGCPAVKPHYKSKNMQKLAAKYEEKGVTWLAVCSTGDQSLETLAKFRKDNEVKHAFLDDRAGKLGRMIGAKKTPHMFILKNGKVLYQGALDKKGGENYVAKALDELLAGKEVSTPRTKPYG